MANPMNKVTMNIPFGDPVRESANAPTTGAIMGAMPMVAVTLERLRCHITRVAVSDDGS